MHVRVYLDAHIGTYMYAETRDQLQVSFLSRVLPCLESESLADLELTKWANLASPPCVEMRLSLLGLKSLTTIPSPSPRGSGVLIQALMLTRQTL